MDFCVYRLTVWHPWASTRPAQWPAKLATPVSSSRTMLTKHWTSYYFTKFSLSIFHYLQSFFNTDIKDRLFILFITIFYQFIVSCYHCDLFNFEFCYQLLILIYWLIKFIYLWFIDQLLSSLLELFATWFLEDYCRDWMAEDG
jgi:hypothetical protein